jgi:hypothetical protein
MLSLAMMMPAFGAGNMQGRHQPALPYPHPSTNPCLTASLGTKMVAFRAVELRAGTTPEALATLANSVAL